MSHNTASLLNPERATYLKAMRAQAASVTVVTTQGAAGTHGATVSAFSSVSADPPTVLVCLHRDSRIAQMVEKNGVFSVNLLTHADQPIADLFAGRMDTQEQEADRFNHLTTSTATTGPILCASTAFCCQVHDVANVGSHRVIFGKVEAIVMEDSVMADDNLASTHPLIYFSGNYHHLGDAM